MDHHQHAGSSPLTRGKHTCSRSARLARGLIPAHAGKTHTVRTPRGINWAHPRSRGENSPLHLTPSEIQGSSPLTRGKHGGCPFGGGGLGLIPAHAGKTWPGLTAPANPWAHPRSRGENIECRPECDAADGSSPLTRGKLGGAPSCQCPRRLIPAHAGKTRARCGCRPTRRAHPRSRGENRRRLATPRYARGSSPLTRGKRSSARLPGPSTGLIPAHAGKTNGHRLQHPNRRAHPRSRGENCRVSPVRPRRVGSSPLTRGKLRCTRADGARKGSSPLTRGKRPLCTN